jgi:DNA-binding MarR family transcriptional regulator
MGQTLSRRRPVFGENVRLAASLAKKVRLGPTYGKVFLLIAGHIDAGQDDPSWSELAEGTRLERNTVRNAIRRLRQRGVLFVEHRGRGERDRYEIRKPRPKGAGRAR